MRNKALVLPNAWDVPSARLFEEAGFPAVATSSAGMLVSLGYADGESIGRGDFLEAVGRIGRVLKVPLSADAVTGFGNSAKEVGVTAKGLIRAGAIGLNIEDADHARKELFPAEKQVEKLEAIRKIGESEGVAMVINARTDALRFGEGNEEKKFEEAVRRCQMYRDAGADCVYPMGLTTREDISHFMKHFEDFPVNVMIRPGLPEIAELQRLGVRRISFGPSASYAVMGFLRRASAEILDRGTFSLLVDGAITYDELNALAGPGR